MGKIVFLTLIAGMLSSCAGGFSGSITSFERGFKHGWNKAAKNSHDKHRKLVLNTLQVEGTPRDIMEFLESTREVIGACYMADIEKSCLIEEYKKPLLSKLSGISGENNISNEFRSRAHVYQALILARDTNELEDGHQHAMSAISIYPENKEARQACLYIQGQLGVDSDRCLDRYHRH